MNPVVKNTKPGAKKTNNVVVIGSGNVATHLSLALKEADYTIVQVYSRNQTHAQALAAQLACDYTTRTADIKPDAGCYLFAVKDDVLPKLLAGMPPNSGLWMHTAGSIAMDVFRGYTSHYGVLYPLQTLSKERAIDFHKVPLFIEGNTAASENKIRRMAEKISGNVTPLPSEKRMYLHLAAVFACNFTNHMYALAAGILEKQQIDWHVLQPLIDETAQKLYAMSPEKAQTGPAVRFDQRVMERHLALLADERLRELYCRISENINNNSAHDGGVFHTITNTQSTNKETTMIDYDLTKIKAFLFDVDGVLSSNRISLHVDGDPMRTVNIKDGYALQLAVKKGFEVGIITGGSSFSVQMRYENLGIKHIYMGSSNKLKAYKDFRRLTGLKHKTIMYCGDDMPDYEVMKKVGLPVAPADAAPEIKKIAKYISPAYGGDGVARDIIEQTLKIHGLWMDNEAFGW